MIMEWYKYIEIVMDHRNVTQQEIADMLGRTRGGVGHWLKGRREPPIADLKKIIDYLDIDFYALFAEEEEHKIRESLYDKELATLSSKLSDGGKEQLKSLAKTISKAEQAEDL